MSVIDKATITNIYHVSEYCAEIESNMQKSESETQPDSAYMRR
jgi:hypothetical protein